MICIRFIIHDLFNARLKCFISEFIYKIFSLDMKLLISAHENSALIDIDVKNRIIFLDELSTFVM